MEKVPEISICIPAYKNTLFLGRLLDSVASQTYKDFEVVITDDSPDDTVGAFVEKYASQFRIKYCKNFPALGTPENWNEGIRQASGKWIKMMHDDDWFASPEALEIFASSAKNHPSCPFFFSAFQNVIEENNTVEIVKCSLLDRFVLWLSPLHLFSKVYVGNPSCTFIRRDIGQFYDSRFKFVVDFEYYIRCFRLFKSYKYIDKVLLSVGFNKEQVTKYTFLVPAVQVPENLVLLDKLGAKILRNPVVFDYYWRMFRNLKIRSVQEVAAFYPGKIHRLIKMMIQFQGRFSLNLLRKGMISKPLMIACYVRSLFCPLSE